MLLLFTAGCLQFEPSELDVSQGGLTGILAAFLAANSSAPLLPTQRFVIVGNQGLGLYSADGGTWTQVDIATNTNVTLSKVIRTGNRFVSVGDDGNNEVVYTSTNGVNWTAAVVTSNCTGVSSLVDLVEGGGRLMAVGAAGASAACAQTSTDDGLTWTQVNTGSAILPFLKVAYNGTNFTAVTSSAGAGMLDWQSSGTSTFTNNGTNPANAGAGAPVAGDLTGVGAVVVWVGTRANANADCFYSNDGGISGWNGSFGPVFNNSGTNYPRAVVTDTGATLAVSVGDNCVFDETTSVANFNWTGAGGQIPGCTAVNFKDMIFESNSSTFFAVGAKSGAAIWSTLNGTTWTEVANVSGVVPNSLASSR